ncbi:prepilin peptidase [Lentzea sp. NBRC 105346]|uniref:prepilin peptidase n=1 Tax=Lentzea sp. NBRC 105346 TaxID=3032205 RepID=UPI0024A3703D|nr:A24 family peptidase [Lentzea sp. NBRC 105346]GLZ30128.1 prepilin peptidase [Lentzea sp. NBRC 105346]
MTVALATTAGALAGPWVRAAVFRLSVPADAPERTTCPRCGFPLSPTVSCRCPSCRTRVALSCGTTEVLTAALLGSIALVAGPRPEVIAFAWLAVVCVALATIDLLVYRLPDRLTLPTYPVLAALFTAAALNAPERLFHAVLAALVLVVYYLLLALMKPGQLGLGDVKLAGLLGMALGWMGWTAVLLATVLTFVLCGLTGLALVVTRRVTLRSDLPLGPFMVYGTFVALFVTLG